MEIVKTAVAGTMESSDVLIQVDPREGGVEIELQSIVEARYGSSIRQSILDVVKSLGVESAKIKAMDYGALDCTIRARAKTALLRAGRG